MNQDYLAVTNIFILNVVQDVPTDAQWHYRSVTIGEFLYEGRVKRENGQVAVHDLKKRHVSVPVVHARQIDDGITFRDGFS